MFKLIACNVFMREACHCIARAPQAMDVEFTELGEHVHCDSLRKLIQSRIDAAEDSGKSYQAILLLFGICGNAGVGLVARKTPLVMPRAHDCCTILLGSKARFQEHFAQAPSTPFSSRGYMERGEYFLRVEDGQSKVHIGDAYAEYVAKYGEEEARYIWEMMHPARAEGEQDRVVFINLPQTTTPEQVGQFEAKAAQEGKQCLRLEGSLALIENLIFGQWDDADFLVVPPGHKSVGVYDWDQVIKTEPIEAGPDATPPCTP